MDAHTVGPFATTAHAFLGNSQVFHTFRFNPDSVNWDYKENTASQDTIGGRVVQLLSVQISGLTIQGRAGSRGELQRLAENVRQIMRYHVTTSRPVEFKVPSRKWDFTVYVQAMPQVGWDVTATSYPYSLQLAVFEDLSGVQSQKLQTAALSRLAEGIGYNPAVHGGDVSGFLKLVHNIEAGKGNTPGSQGGTTLGAGQGGNGVNLPPANDQKAKEILMAARSQIGVPYVWAASNPLGPAGGPGAGFDCSGFTSWVYKQAGIYLAPCAQTQYDLCRQKQVLIADINSLTPGDLIFYNYPSTQGCGFPVTHVGIFWDGKGASGNLIDTHTFGDTVRIRTMAETNPSQYFYAGGRPR